MACFEPSVADCVWIRLVSHVLSTLVRLIFLSKSCFRRRVSAQQASAPLSCLWKCTHLLSCFCLCASARLVTGGDSFLRRLVDLIYVWLILIPSLPRRLPCVDFERGTRHIALVRCLITYFDCVSRETLSSVEFASWLRSREIRNLDRLLCSCARHIYVLFLLGLLIALLVASWFMTMLLNFVSGTLRFYRYTVLVFQEIYLLKLN